MRNLVLTAVVLAAIAIAGIVAIARSPEAADCDPGELCPAPPDCVNPKPARRRARDAMRGPRSGLAPFGFNDGSVIAGQAGADLVAQLHVELGATLIRFALDWRRVEPERGRYDFSLDDRIYCAAIERGVAPVIAISAAPSWAALPREGCPSCHRGPKPEHLDALGELSRVVALRYPGAAAIEAWNEPNLNVFWESPDAGRYVEVLRAVSEGVQRSGSKIPVLGGSLANAPADPAAQEQLRAFVARMYEDGAAGLMDALSIHPYPLYAADDPRQRFDPMIELVRSVAREHGHPDPRLWITELGVRTEGGVDHSEAMPEEPAPAVTPAEQAQTLTTFYRRVSEDPQIEAVIFHTLLEPDGRVASRGGYGWLVPEDSELRTKPVWCSMLQITRPEGTCRDRLGTSVGPGGLR